MLLEGARALHQAGRWQEAAVAYRRVLDTDPQNVEALHLFGALLNQAGQFAAAVEVMQRAVHCRPADPALRTNLGNALKDAGRLVDAQACFRAVLRDSPDFVAAQVSLGALLYGMRELAESEQWLRRATAAAPENAHAHNHLGMVLGDIEKFDEAIACFRRAVALRPDFGHAHYNLGVALAQRAQFEAAVESYRQALSLVSNSPSLHSDLGDALFSLGRTQEAEEAYRQALALEPSFALAHVGMGNLHRLAGRPADAEVHYRNAIRNAPDLAAAHSNLGLVLFEAGRPQEAEHFFQESLRLEPRLYQGHANHAHMLMRLGRLEEAERGFRQALEIRPDFADARSNLAFLLNHMPSRSPADIYAEHAEFGRHAGAPPSISFRNDREPERRLRIGYVSGDLRNHSVAFFIEPVLAHHDRTAVEVICYYNYPQADATTTRLRSYSQHWYDVFGLPHERLADLMRDHAIDILVDLSGHTANNRLLTFARRPAPVSATWLGYLNTTGLDTIGWRITDAVATPPGSLDRLHTEMLARLPQGQWCYRAPDPCPPTGALPMTKNGGCTFGAFSTATKINAQVVNLWCELLRGVPESRLVILLNGIQSVPSGYREAFRREGVEESRVELLPSKGFNDYLALHASVDVMLDTFPYTGGTTTCHALWMGVPVVSHAGETATSRGGASLLTAVGLDEFIADTHAGYISIAAGLAQDAARLAALRSTMRERMQESALMNEARFTRELESAYRAMWREWCATSN